MCDNKIAQKELHNRAWRPEEVIGLFEKLGATAINNVEPRPHFPEEVCA